MSKVLVNETSLTGIADAIRGKNGKTDKYKPSEMAAAILAITGGGGGVELPPEAYVITGTASGMFRNNNFVWYIDWLGDEITTQNLSDCNNMFYGADKIEEIPFELNCDPSKAVNFSYAFQSCKKLKNIPKINNCKLGTITSMFNGCSLLEYLPDDIADWFDWSAIDSATSGYTYGLTGVFQNCTSLRNIPMDFLNHAPVKGTGTTQSYLYRGFNTCYSLDELKGLPCPWSDTFAGNVFYYTFVECYRVKDITFVMPDGQPYAMQWKSQVIDLTANVGIVKSNGLGPFLKDTHFTEDTRVTDDATYQALKDNPDWWTTKTEYSRYNYDSAVATINTLPDTSAYLATAGGTNTIKFIGAAGSLTDGGAINNLTAEEIAVASAKGWTVTLS